MTARRTLLALLLLSPALALSGCVKKVGAWHVRLTIGIGTPRGVRTASGVYDVRYSFSTNVNGGGWQSEAVIYGEAVFVELDDGSNIVALIPDANMPAAALTGRGSGYDAVKSLEDKGELPGGPVAVPRAMWPRFYSFADLNDPSSAVLVHQTGSGNHPLTRPIDRVAATLGAGYGVRSVTIEKVPDAVPVTRGLEARMPVALAKLREPPGTMVLVGPGEGHRLGVGDLVYVS